MQPTEALTPSTEHRNWLAALIIRQPDRFLPQLAAALARWQTLSRGFRRRFTRRVAATAAGAALILAMAGSPLLVPSARAATITVDEVTCTLVDAIRSANTNAAVGGCASGAPGLDTIDLQADVTLTAAAGNYSGYTGLPAVTSEIVIDGNGFTIERDGASPDFRILYVGSTGDLTLNNVTISGGVADLNGGGIYIDAATVAINDSTLRDNYAENDGGALFNEDGTLTITDSIVRDNYAQQDAGGLYQNVDNAETTITGSTFENNKALSNVSGHGGAIYLDEGIMTITDSLITKNSAGEYGGGIIAFLSDADLTIERTTIYDNSAREGGGLLILAGTVEIIDSIISGNEAEGDGGGASNRYGNLTLSGVTVQGNTAGGDGGGVYSVYSTVDIVNSTISGNEAETGDGGGVANLDGTVTLANVTVTANSAGDEGGGLSVPYGGYGEFTIARSIISGNTSGSNSSNEIYNYTFIPYLTVANFYVNDGVVNANADNVFSHGGQTSAQAFQYFTPGAGDANASSSALNVPLGDILVTTPADNGGPTSGVAGDPILTHDLVLGSPALDRIPEDDCAGDPTNSVDQRGFVRPFDVVGQNNEGDDICDVGAVEYGSSAPGGTAVFMSARTAGTTGDGLDFGSEDIILWDGTEWSMWFDGSAAGLEPKNAKHNINAFWIPDAGEDVFVFSFAQNRRTVPGVGPKVDGMDLVHWNGSAFSFWFDGSDVFLTNKTQEKIDALHVLPGSESPIGAGCLAYLLVSTQGPGKVPNHSGGQLRFQGEDVLGFCATSLGETTTGLWHMVLDGSAEGMPRNSTDSISLSDDGQTLYLTTQGTFNVDTAAGGHSMVYEFDFGAGTISGPSFSAPAEGLPEKVDGLQMD